jgi:hypothetical protein
MARRRHNYTDRSRGIHSRGRQHRPRGGYPGGGHGGHDGGSNWWVWVVVIVAVVMWGSSNQGGGSSEPGKTPERGGTSTVCTEQFRGGC